jgi:hypothetical protein
MYGYPVNQEKEIPPEKWTTGNILKAMKNEISSRTT